MEKMDLSPVIGFLDDFKLESLIDESGVPVQTSSVMSDLNDSDVDSPCWKGTWFFRYAFRVPGPMSSGLPKIEGEACGSLNPQHLIFFFLEVLNHS